MGRKKRIIMIVRSKKEKTDKIYFIIFIRKWTSDIKELGRKFYLLSFKIK